MHIFTKNFFACGGFSLHKIFQFSWNFAGIPTTLNSTLQCVWEYLETYLYIRIPDILDFLIDKM